MKRREKAREQERRQVFKFLLFCFFFFLLFGFFCGNFPTLSQASRGRAREQGHWPRVSGDWVCICVVVGVGLGKYEGTLGSSIN